MIVFVSVLSLIFNHPTGYTLRNSKHKFNRGSFCGVGHFFGLTFYQASGNDEFHSDALTAASGSISLWQ